MKPILFLILVALGIPILLGACATNGKPNPQSVIEGLEKLIAKKAAKNSEYSHLSLLVFSEKHNISIDLQTNQESEEAFHIASVGKLFNTALIGKAVDAGLIQFTTPISNILKPELLQGLFVYEAEDLQHLVTIEHLLTHTSGLGDYFADPDSTGTPLFQTMITQPTRRWNPEDLIEYHRSELDYRSKPGEHYYYSDTGFILLGLIIEELFQAPLPVVLHQEILEPLGMERTWMPFLGSPIRGTSVIRPIFIQGTDVSTYPSITLDWAGGIASTMENLLIFNRALWDGEIVSPNTLAYLQTFDHEFMRGIDYGLGLMRYDFGKFFFLLSSYPQMIGHMGILGTQVLYNPENDLHIILSFGSDKATEESVRLVIEVLGRVRSQLGP